MYTLNITKAVKKISVNEFRDFIFENYHKRIGFPKENNYYSIKRSKEKSFAVAWEQIHRKIILIMLNDTINHL